MGLEKIATGKRVVLAGATGLVGGYCLQLLLDAPDIQEVIVLTRRSLNQTHSKLKEHFVDFSNLDQLSLPKITVDSIFCCLGTTIKQAGSREEFEKVDLGYVLALAKWGIKHKAQHFLVISSMGANENSPIFYSRTKGRMEAEIAKLGYRSIDVFRPSLLVGPRKKPRFGEKVSEKVFQILNPGMLGPLRKYRSIAAEVVARAMVKASADAQPSFRVHLSDEIQKLVGKQHILPIS